MFRSQHAVAALVAAGLVVSSSYALTELVDFSPDGRQLAYEWSDGIAITTLGGATESVTGSEHGNYVRWSPTGRQLALFTRGAAQSELKLYNPATKKTRSVGGNLRPPFAWREDGSRFACIHDRPGGKAEVVWYNLAENGVSFRVDLPYSVDTSAPMVWLPTTDDLAFVAADHNVYTAESGEFKKITTSGDVLGLNLYAGGKKLVWARRSPNLRYILLSVYAYDLTARNVARLDFPNRVAALNPDPRTAPESIDRVAIAPDGAHLLLYAVMGGSTRAIVLHTVSMDGRAARQLQRAPDGPGEPITAAWSRDGHSIAVRSFLSGTQKLFTTAADGKSGTVVRTDAGR
jgi:hypothetical protein